MQGCAAEAGLSWTEALEKGPIAWFSLGFGVQEEGATSLNIPVPSSEFSSSFRCLGVAVPSDWTEFPLLAGTSEGHIPSRDIIHLIINLLT